MLLCRVAMRSDGNFSGYRFFVCCCFAPRPGTLRWTSNQKTECFCRSLCYGILRFPHDVFQHLFFIVSDVLTEQRVEYPDELAAYGYDGLFLLQRILAPLGVVLMQFPVGVILANKCNRCIEEQRPQTSTSTPTDGRCPFVFA